MIKGITFAVSTFVVIPLATNAHKHGDGHDHSHHGHSHKQDNNEHHDDHLSEHDNHKHEHDHHHHAHIQKDGHAHSDHVHSHDNSEEHHHLDGHSHEHHHEDDHVHSQSFSYSDEHKEFYEPNIHKRMVNSIIKLTHADCLLAEIDTFMRPLPFLAQSLISTSFISVVPIFFIYLMNMSVTAQNRDSFTHVLLSFALGGLLGDVFFHTLPHMSSGSH